MKISVAPRGGSFTDAINVCFDGRLVPVDPVGTVVNVAIQRGWDYYAHQEFRKALTTPEIRRWLVPAMWRACLAWRRKDWGYIEEREFES